MSSPLAELGGWRSREAISLYNNVYLNRKRRDAFQRASRERSKPVEQLRERVEKELRGDILPFWLKYAVDEQYGGFRGQIANDLTIDPLAHKGLILNARILWTFSKAYKVYGDEVYLRTGRRAYDYLLRYFWDADFGGVYWMVNHLGEPVETKKRIYGQAFTVYALAEYASASAEKQPLENAIALHRLIENASHDAKNGGYFETYERDWKLAAEQRLSEVDMDEKKSMNTHLHLLEAYANLLRGWNDPELRQRLRELVRIFLDRIIEPKTHHFRMFFDEQWHDHSKCLSFGHDIEGSWLICEAAEVLGDPGILKEAREKAVKMAQAVYDQAIDQDGGLLYEGTGTEIIDSDKHWWPQAEAVVGFLNAYELSGKDHFLKASQRSWEFIENHIIDREHGEWFWKVSRAGKPSQDKYKVDPWKCPYHNSRTCFEVMERLDKMAKNR
ncbi:MAG: AGE family epimerase/isomerase [Terriglobales bacterium]